jgi:hypothetical protein
MKDPDDTINTPYGFGSATLLRRYSSPTRILATVYCVGVTIRSGNES